MRDDGRHARDRRAHAPPRPRTAPLVAGARPLARARGRRDRRPAGAPSRHDRRLGRARRPGVRPAGGAARARRGELVVAAPARRAHRRGRRVLPRRLHDRARRRRSAHRDPRAASDGGARLDLPQVPAAGRRTGRRRRRGGRSRTAATRDRADEHGPDAAARVRREAALAGGADAATAAGSALDGTAPVDDASRAPSTGAISPASSSAARSRRSRASPLSRWDFLLKAREIVSIDLSASECSR